MRRLQGEYVLSVGTEPLRLRHLLLHGRHPDVYEHDVEPGAGTPALVLEIIRESQHNESKVRSENGTPVELPVDLFQLTAAFSSDAQGFALTDRDRRQTYTDGITVNQRARQIAFRGFHDLPDGQYYWSLPTKFLKNKAILSRENRFISTSDFSLEYTYSFYDGLYDKSLVPHTDHRTPGSSSI